MTRPKLVDKDTGRFPNLTKDESDKLTELFDKHGKRIFQTAKNDLINYHNDLDSGTFGELMQFFELYEKAKQVRLIPEA